MVVISFMSSDDRKVKEKFRELGREGRARGADQASAAAGRGRNGGNPPSRSAKLRAIEIAHTSVPEQRMVTRPNSMASVARV